METKCTLQITNSWHKLRCWSKLVIKFSSKTRTKTIFDFSRRVWNSYKKSTTINPKIGFKITLGIRNWASLTLSLNLSLKFKRTIYCHLVRKNPPTFKLGADLSLSVSTNSKAQVKVLFVRGGVFFKGTFFSVSTSPYALLKYNVSKKQVELIGKWVVSRKKVCAKGGFYIGKLKFGKFSICSGKKKWTIYSDRWVKKVPRVPPIPIPY